MCLGIPGEIVSVSDEHADLATVDVAGVRRPVNIGLLDGIHPGDWVLVHVGFAMSRIDAAEAAATLKMLESFGSTYDDELAAFSATGDGP